MHLTLQQLRLFEAVSRNGSYTRAAAELHLTQPAVSIQIKRLEEQVGLPLFEQVGKKIFLTAAGKAMNAAGLDILGRVAELRDTVEALKGEVKGQIQISGVTTAKYFMPHLMGRFLNKYPDVEPMLKFADRTSIVKRLQQNTDDFIIMSQIPQELNLACHPFLENTLGVVAPPDHPLAGKKQITLEDLAKYRFLTREKGAGTQLLFDQFLDKHGINITPHMELGSSEAVKQGVMAGLGLAVLSLHSLNLEYSAGKLVILDVEGFPIKRPWYAVHLKGKRLSLVAQTFLEYILDEGPQILHLELP